MFYSSKMATPECTGLRPVAWSNRLENRARSLRHKVKARGPTAPALAAETDSGNATGLASGSFRSVAGIDVQRALKEIASSYPDLLVAFGGHSAAAGATIRVIDMERFRQAFTFAVAEQTGGAVVTGPTLWTDGELDVNAHDLKSVQALEAMGPFGRGFEAPLYSGTFRVATYRALTNGRHGRLRLRAREPDAGGSLVFH